MKRILVSLVIALLVVSAAGAELTILAKYSSLFSVDALEAAKAATPPEGINVDTLTQFERELYELGFAAGYDAGHDAALAPQVKTYIVNKSTHKFHNPDCKGAGNISEKNRMEITTTRDELISWGYAPCGTCNP